MYVYVYDRAGARAVYGGGCSARLAGGAGGGGRHAELRHHCRRLTLGLGVRVLLLLLSCDNNMLSTTVIWDNNIDTLITFNNTLI